MRYLFIFKALFLLGAAVFAAPGWGQLSAQRQSVCAACHGADGNSGTPAYPKLAQQHPEYLVKQLQEFKSDKRANAVMKGFASALSDEDMKNISYWLASKKAKPGFAKDKELVTLGERIYRGGIASKSVAACAGCHGPNGSGIPAQYPRISGQHAEYTEAQLVAYRSGERKNSVQMSAIASRMSDAEIKAVADYIAGVR
jgi:cytochrome c553